MAVTRLIQGGVSTTALRALLLTRSAASPVVQVVAASGVAVASKAQVRAVPAAGSSIRKVLDARGVRVYSIDVAGLTPGTTYRVLAAVGSEQLGFTSTTLPMRVPAEGLTVAVATCYYDGFHVDRALAASLRKARFEQAPAFHIWAGDNLYVDVPTAARANLPVDQTVDRYLSYYLDSDYAEVRSIAPTFTTFDDHEYWNNYPQSQIWLSRSWDEEWHGYSDAGHGCMELFQNSLNIGQAVGPGYYSFDIYPLRFFVLDTRSYRTRDGAATSRGMLTQQARAALRTWSLRDGPGVLVLGQPLWIATGGWADLNPPSYAQDYAFIWKCLRESSYDTLVISGDIHHSRVMKIAFTGTNNRFVYEFVSSPACHIPGELLPGQSHGDLDEIPSKIENAGVSVAASHYFGTDVPNTYGLLRFVPMGTEVRVGAKLVEHWPKDRAAPAKPIKTVPAATKTYAMCSEPNLFNLRMR